MKKTILWATLFAMTMSVAAMAGGKKSSDPTVIKIGNHEVPLSEFEYLYKKNNAQQQSGMSLDEYIDMFVNYKLKVLAAKDAGLDTAASYRHDMGQYATQLADPYLQDKDMRDSLLRAAYDHHKKVFDVTYILIPPGSDEAARQSQRAYADSLHAALLAGADFDAAIKTYMDNPANKGGGGRIKFTSGSVPYRFEDQAYLTPVGQYSPVFKSSYGLHILRVDGREDNPGEVKVRHILKLTRDKSPEEIAHQKRAIDSLYVVLKNGADFPTVASQETEDPSGKTTGGDLPWFGIGRMVPEFEAAAFALAPGEISRPIETAYGYHILVKEGSRPVGTLEELTPRITDIMDHDFRSGLIRQRAVDNYAAANKLKTDKKLLSAAEKIVAADGLGEEARKRLAALKGNLFTINGRSAGMKDVIAMLPPGQPVVAADAFASAVDAARNKLVADDMTATLPDREPAYRNLYNEYSDGILLFEISNREIWDRANKDLEGLEKFYQAHRDEYTWDKPHYLGFVVSATNDSIASAAVGYLETLDVEDTALPTELRKKFGNNAKIERVNAARGEYPIIDYVAFDGQLPETANRWKAFRAFRGHVADQPSSAMDVKGKVSVAYQQQLESDWLKSLRKRYPVTVNRKLLNNL